MMPEMDADEYTDRAIEEMGHGQLSAASVYAMLAISERIREVYTMVAIAERIRELTDSLSVPAPIGRPLPTPGPVSREVSEEEIAAATALLTERIPR